MITNPYRYAGTWNGFGEASRDFDGTNDFIDCGDVLDGTISGSDCQFTLSIWAKGVAGSGKTFGALINKYVDSLLSENQRQIFFATDETNARFRFAWSTELGTGRLNVRESNDSFLSASTWRHLVAVYDGTITNTGDRCKLYADGSELPDGVGAGKSTLILNESGITDEDIQSNGTGRLSIGGGSNSAGTSSVRNFDGLLSDARIYDALLSASDIADLYNGVDVQTNLVGWWKLNETDPLGSPEFEDFSANNNHGTNNGTIASTDGPADV